MKDAFIDFAIGGAGGLVFGLGRALLGTGLLGALAAPVIAGSVVKGPRGQILSTVAGFVLTSGLFGGSQSAAASNSAGVM